MACRPVGYDGSITAVVLSDGLFFSLQMAARTVFAIAFFMLSRLRGELFQPVAIAIHRRQTETVRRLQAQLVAHSGNVRVERARRQIVTLRPDGFFNIGTRQRAVEMAKQ